MPSLKDLHFYRRTHADLTQATSTGGVISAFAALTMLALFVSQLSAYLSVRHSTEVVMDPSDGPHSMMVIDFDVTLPKVACGYASVDLYDSLGLARLNISGSTIEGVAANKMMDLHWDGFTLSRTRVVTDDQARYISGAKAATNTETPLPRDLPKKRHHTRQVAIKEFSQFPVSEHKAWRDDWGEEAYAPELTSDDFAARVGEFKFAMVQFYAPWCHYCTQLKPVWEHAAGLIEKTTTDYGEDDEAEGWHGFESREKAMFEWEEHNIKNNEHPVTLHDFMDMKREEKGLSKLPLEGNRQILIAKVDCTKSQNLCFDQQVMGYPTVRIYRGLPRSVEEYQGDRTARAITKYVMREMPDSMHNEEEQPEEEQKLKQAAEDRILLKMTDATKEGCNLVGSVRVRKVPGKLVFSAHSNDQTMDLSVLNTSHVVHHLGFRRPEEVALNDEEKEGFVKILEEAANLARRTADGGDGTSQYHRAHMKGVKRTMMQRVDGHQSGVDGMIWTLDESRFFSTEPLTVQTHHVKLVRTDMQLLPYRPFEIFQMQAFSGSFRKEPSGVAGPHSHQAPSIEISYEVSPLTTVVKETRGSLSEFLTSLCAIIGGVFTVIGMIDNVIYHGPGVLGLKPQQRSMAS